MTQHNNRSINISDTDKIIIQTTEDVDDKAFDETPVYAINWFNLKSSFFYKLYTLLASKYVRKVSGRLHFKGQLIEQLEGNKNYQRENLLIVSYRTPQQFLKLVSFKFFQLISIFRIMAVERFCFAFTESQLPLFENKSFSFHKKQSYLVYHFQGDKQCFKNNIQAFSESVGKEDIGIYYCGTTSAKLVREKSGNQQSANFFMDGILLFAAESRADLNNFIKSELFQSFKNKNTENALYLFSRSH